MLGPITARKEAGLHPNMLTNSSIVFCDMRLTVPRHPQCIAVITLLTGSYRKIGTQSAVLTPIAHPSRFVTNASIQQSASLSILGLTTTAILSPCT